MRRITSSLLDNYYQNADNLLILDAGCGTGAELNHLRKYGQLIGVDISNQALAFCRKRRQKNHILNASISQLPFKDNSFDLVTSFDVIYHLWVQDDVSCLKELHRVLKHNGILLIRVNAYWFLKGPQDEAIFSRERYTAGKLVKRVRKAGFELERVTYANTFLFPIIAVIRLLERFTILKVRLDSSTPLSIINAMLASVLAFEANLLSHINLPFGLSVICLAQKR